MVYDPYSYMDLGQDIIGQPATDWASLLGAGTSSARAATGYGAADEEDPAANWRPRNLLDPLVHPVRSLFSYLSRPWNAVGHLLQAGISAYQGRTDLASSDFKSFLKNALGLIPFSQTLLKPVEHFSHIDVALDRADEVTGREVLDRMATGDWGNLSDAIPGLFNDTGAGIAKFQRGGPMDLTGKGALGLAMMIGLDPVTWTSGLGALTRTAKAMKMGDRLLDWGAAARIAERERAMISINIPKIGGGAIWGGPRSLSVIQNLGRTASALTPEIAKAARARMEDAALGLFKIPVKAVGWLGEGINRAIGPNGFVPLIHRFGTAQDIYDYWGLADKGATLNDIRNVRAGAVAAHVLQNALKGKGGALEFLGLSDAEAGDFALGVQELSKAKAASIQDIPGLVQPLRFAGRMRRDAQDLRGEAMTMIGDARSQIAELEKGGAAAADPAAQQAAGAQLAKGLEMMQEALASEIAPQVHGATWFYNQVPDLDLSKGISRKTDLRQVFGRWLSKVNQEFSDEVVREWMPPHVRVAEEAFVKSKGRDVAAKAVSEQWRSDSIRMAEYVRKGQVVIDGRGRPILSHEKAGLMRAVRQLESVNDPALVKEVQGRLAELTHLTSGENATEAAKWLDDIKGRYGEGYRDLVLTANAFGDLIDENVLLRSSMGFGASMDAGEAALAHGLIGGVMKDVGKRAAVLGTQAEKAAAEVTGKVKGATGVGKAFGLAYGKREKEMLDSIEKLREYGPLLDAVATGKAVDPKEAVLWGDVASHAQLLALPTDEALFVKNGPLAGLDAGYVSAILMNKGRQILGAGGKPPTDEQLFDLVDLIYRGMGDHSRYAQEGILAGQSYAEWLAIKDPKRWGALADRGGWNRHAPLNDVASPEKALSEIGGQLGLNREQLERAAAAWNAQWAGKADQLEGKLAWLKMDPAKLVSEPETVGGWLIKSQTDELESLVAKRLAGTLTEQENGRMDQLQELLKAHEPLPKEPVLVPKPEVPMPPQAVEGAALKPAAAGAAKAAPAVAATSPYLQFAKLIDDVHAARGRLETLAPEAGRKYIDGLATSVVKSDVMEQAIKGIDKAVQRVMETRPETILAGTPVEVAQKAARATLLSQIQANLNTHLLSWVADAPSGKYPPELLEKVASEVVKKFGRGKKGEALVGKLLDVQSQSWNIMLHTPAYVKRLLTPEGLEAYAKYAGIFGKATKDEIADNAAEWMARKLRYMEVSAADPSQKIPHELMMLPDAELTMKNLFLERGVTPPERVFVHDPMVIADQMGRDTARLLSDGAIANNAATLFGTRIEGAWRIQKSGEKVFDVYPAERRQWLMEHIREEGQKAAGNAKLIQGWEHELTDLKTQYADAFKLLDEQGGRPLKNDYWNALLGQKDPGRDWTVVFPGEIADKLDALGERMKPREINKFLQGLDSYYRWFKGWALFGTSYAVGNFVQDWWLNHKEGWSLYNPRVLKMAFKTGQMERQIAGKSFDTVVEVLGRKMTLVELADMADSMGVRRGFFGRELERPEVMPDGFTFAKERVKGVKKWIAAPAKWRGAAPQWWQKANTISENTARMTQWLLEAEEQVKAGASWKDALANAADGVNRNHYDYNLKTPIERNVLDRLFPFYTWSSKNIPAMLVTALQKPGRLQNLEDIRAAISTGGMPTEATTPEWVRERAPVRIGERIIPTQRLLGAYDINAAEPAAFVNKWTEMLSPMGLGWALNLARNYDPYFHREIQQQPGQRTKFAGVYMPQWMEYFLRQAMPRPVREVVGLLPTGRPEYDLPMPERIARLVGGFKSYQWTPERLGAVELRTIQDKRRQIVSDMHRAAIAGDYGEVENLTRELRTELAGRYQQFGQNQQERAGLRAQIGW